MPECGVAARASALGASGAGAAAALVRDGQGRFRWHGLLMTGLLTPADENEELAEAVTGFILRGAAASISESFWDFFFWNLEERRAERCGVCGFPLKRHAINFFRGAPHQFEPMVLNG